MLNFGLSIPPRSCKGRRQGFHNNFAAWLGYAIFFLIWSALMTSIFISGPVESRNIERDELGDTPLSMDDLYKILSVGKDKRRLWPYYEDFNQHQPKRGAAPLRFGR